MWLGEREKVLVVAALRKGAQFESVDEGRGLIVNEEAGVLLKVAAALERGDTIHCAYQSTIKDQIQELDSEIPPLLTSEQATEEWLHGPEGEGDGDSREVRG